MLFITSGALIGDLRHTIKRRGTSDIADNAITPAKFAPEPDINGIPDSKTKTIANKVRVLDLHMAIVEYLI
jgi:hypothetical protein